MECEPAPTIASSFADSVSAAAWSFAVNSSPKRRRMRAWPFSNASRYSYGGASWALLEYASYGWAVRDMDKSSCYSFELERLAEPEKAAAKDAADIMLLNEFKRRKLIDDSIASRHDIPAGKCRELASELGSSAHLAIEADVPAEKAKWKASYDAAFKKLEAIKACA